MPELPDRQRVALEVKPAHSRGQRGLLVIDEIEELLEDSVLEHGLADDSTKALRDGEREEAVRLPPIRGELVERLLESKLDRPVHEHRG